MTSIEDIQKLQRNVDREMIWHEIFVKISSYLTRFLIKTPLSGNQVTALSICLGVIGVVLLTSPGILLFSLGVLFLYLYWLFDLCDGQVARHKKSTSLKGVYLDLLGHLIIHPAIFLTIGIHLFNESGDILDLILGGFVAFLFLTYYANHKVYLVCEGKRKKELEGSKPLQENVKKENPFFRFMHSIQKSIRYLGNVVTFFLLINVVSHLLLPGVFNLTRYLLFFYLIVYFLLLISQIIVYLNKFPKTD